MTINTAFDGAARGRFTSLVSGVILTVLMLCLSWSANAAAPASSAEQKAKTSAESANELPQVLLDTSAGKIILQLRPDIAPKTVKNFLDYVESDFYSGTIFHRVIPGFMVQGGGFTEDLNRKKTGAPIPLEAKPTASNVRGTVAMARTNDPNSATSQFFINLVDNAYLDAGSRGSGYAVFGKVVSGMGAVDKIARAQTQSRNGMQNVPVNALEIRSARVLKSDERVTLEDQESN